MSQILTLHLCRVFRYLWEEIEFDSGGQRSVKTSFTSDQDGAVVRGSQLHWDAPNILTAGLFQCTASNQYGKALSPVIDFKRASMLCIEID